MLAIKAAIKELIEAINHDNAVQEMCIDKNILKAAKRRIKLAKSELILSIERHTNGTL